MLRPAILPLLALAGCGERIGAGPGEPMLFLGANVEEVARDMIEVRVSAAHPPDFAAAAYADCVAAGHARREGYAYVNRLSVLPIGNGDAIGEKSTYLLSAVAPGGRNVLNATEIARHCTAHKFPTE